MSPLARLHPSLLASGTQLPFLSTLPPAPPSSCASPAAFRLPQVRHLVTEYCILPIGLRDVHEKAPYYKAVLLYGANRTGKSMLCQAIANSAGATLFDLSPDVTNGKYRGKGETTKLVHMVHKVARLYAPSVITIDHFEKVSSAALVKGGNTVGSCERRSGRVREGKGECSQERVGVSPVRGCVVSKSDMEGSIEGTSEDERYNKRGTSLLVAVWMMAWAHLS